MPRDQPDKIGPFTMASIAASLDLYSVFAGNIVQHLLEFPFAPSDNSLAFRKAHSLHLAARVQCAGAVEREPISRACRAIAISAEPPNTILMPTSSPIAQAAVPGRPARMIAAKIRSMMPLASIQPHRPDSSRLCSSANMIEATPSITKNTMRTKVSERTPLNGHNSSKMPAAIPRIAETSDHQKPGAWRIQKVVVKPAIPLMRKSQQPGSRPRAWRSAE